MPIVLYYNRYNATRIPNIKQPFDLKSCPLNFKDHAWTPWLNSTPPMPGPKTPVRRFLGSVAGAGKWRELNATARSVSGWCCDPLIQNGTGPSTVTFHVTDNNGSTTQLGSTVANIFRDKVVQAGCASHNHGFQIILDLLPFNRPEDRYHFYAVASRPASVGTSTHQLISQPVCFRGVTAAPC